ncbi:MAG: hypothetical protein QOF40_362, partial [Actinomycetota bacterium]|nr:hypothetical protein [Actinomycetota bacterium]
MNVSAPTEGSVSVGIDIMSVSPNGTASTKSKSVMRSVCDPDIPSTSDVRSQPTPEVERAYIHLHVYAHHGMNRRSADRFSVDA